MDEAKFLARFVIYLVAVDCVEITRAFFSFKYVNQVLFFLTTFYVSRTCCGLFEIKKINQKAQNIYQNMTKISQKIRSKGNVYV